MLLPVVNGGWHDAGMRVMKSVSVSFEPGLLAAARDLAKARHQSFSGFVASLVEAEVGKEAGTKRRVPKRK